MDLPNYFLTEDDLRSLYDHLLGSAHLNREVIRRCVLKYGFPEETEEEVRLLMENNVTTLRGTIWMLLLDVPQTNASEYFYFVKKGPSLFFDKIKRDTSRTFPSDKVFQARVPESKLIRVLNAFIHKYCDVNSAHSKEYYFFSYIQGMNVLAAPFLYTMNEVDAFYSFAKFITEIIPRYVSPSMDGVLDGCALVSRLVQEIDPEYASFLLSNELNPQVYLFAPLYSFNLNIPPLEEVVELWDIYVAFGFHLHLVFCAMHVLQMKDALYQSS